ncbi:GTP cyclohydrolase II [Paraburkholderia xenovorans LB400]|uniref:GTP cyclohydrolase II n=1 Tax=Paraburkholderia xenovorans (strain LB400) TaxID=266265 RepID=Q145D3_PARXL|nr:GTP cyclohydrolase II [Paraburkholderia xenovorans LB400]
MGIDESFTILIVKCETQNACNFSRCMCSASLNQGYRMNKNKGIAVVLALLLCASISHKRGVDVQVLHMTKETRTEAKLKAEF